MYSFYLLKSPQPNRVPLSTTRHLRSGKLNMGMIPTPLPPSSPSIRKSLTKLATKKDLRSRLRNGSAPSRSKWRTWGV